MVRRFPWTLNVLPGLEMDSMSEWLQSIDVPDDGTVSIISKWQGDSTLLDNPEQGHGMLGTLPRQLDLRFATCIMPAEIKCVNLARPCNKSLHVHLCSRVPLRLSYKCPPPPLFPPPAFGELPPPLVFCLDASPSEPVSASDPCAPPSVPFLGWLIS